MELCFNAIVNRNMGLWLFLGLWQARFFYQFSSILTFSVAVVFLSVNRKMNFVRSRCRRLNLNELVRNAPVYSSASGKDSVSFIGDWALFFVAMKDCLLLNLLPLYLDITGGGTFRRWATQMTAGSAKNGRDSYPKFLGIKKFGGEVSALCFAYEFLRLLVHAIFCNSYPNFMC